MHIHAVHVLFTAAAPAVTVWATKYTKIEKDKYIYPHSPVQETKDRSRDGYLVRRVFFCSSSSHFLLSSPLVSFPLLLAVVVAQIRGLSRSRLTFPSPPHGGLCLFYIIIASRLQPILPSSTRSCRFCP